jgi:hypothetical protein
VPASSEPASYDTSLKYRTDLIQPDGSPIVNMIGTFCLKLITDLVQLNATPQLAICQTACETAILEHDDGVANTGYAVAFTMTVTYY